MDDCNFEKTPMLEDLGRYIEAGELRAAAGDTIGAIRLFILGGDQNLAAKCLCDAFWEQMPYGTAVTDLNAKTVSDLEKISTEINVSVPPIKSEVRIPSSNLIIVTIHEWFSPAGYVPGTANRR